MERRKFLTGLGALAAGGAAAIGTGAFTSVSANRGLTVQVADDADAMLSIEPEDSPNGDVYVHSHDGVVSIDLTDSAHWENAENAGNSYQGADGVNDDAYTVIRDLLQVQNLGTQNVYVWAEGLPEEVRMFHDDDNGENYKMSGSGNNQGAFSDTSNLNPNDPDDDSDAQNPGGYEAAPLLQPGDTLENVGLLVDTRGGSDLDFDDDIILKAVAEDEA